MHWIDFNNWCASRSNRGQVRRGKGIQALWSHTELIVNNLTVPMGPVTREQLPELALAALKDAARFQLPWMFGLPEPWLDCPTEEASAALAPLGLGHLMYMTVMETAGAMLHEPLRPLPSDVIMKRAEAETEFDALHLNSLAYGMPQSVTEDVLESQTYFPDPTKEFGIVVYEPASGTPVSTATAIDLGGDWVYIAAVATHPEHRQRGYAEVAMRAAIAAAPKKRIALDASRMGEPLYAQMGFERRFRWNFWAPSA